MQRRLPQACASLDTPTCVWLNRVACEFTVAEFGHFGEKRLLKSDHEALVIEPTQTTLRAEGLALGELHVP